MKPTRIPFALQIFIGLLSGIFLGLILMIVPDGTAVANRYIKPFGTIFLNLLKFVVVPVVLLSITCGILSMKDAKKVGSIGVQTIIYYICTTALAVAIALVLASAARGAGLFRAMQVSNLEYTPPVGGSLMDTVVSFFPSNLIEPLLNASMLQVIVIALFLGFGILLCGEKGYLAAKIVDSLNTVFIRIMDMILTLSPFGVAFLLAPVVTENGAGLLADLALVVLVAYVGYIVHLVLVYSLTVKLLAKISPPTFFKGMASAIMMAFSSASSVGTLPLTMECSEKLGADREVSSFVLPLGATLNMDGTAIYQGICAVFIAASYGIELSAGEMLSIVLTATLASIGTAGVPGAGMIMLAMVLQSVNIPVEGIALVAGIDRVFDMGRTAVNITGDATCALIVSRSMRRKAGRRE